MGGCWGSWFDADVTHENARPPAHVSVFVYLLTCPWILSIQRTLWPIVHRGLGTAGRMGFLSLWMGNISARGKP